MSDLPIQNLINILIFIVLCIGCKPNISTSDPERSAYKGFVALPSSQTHVVNSNDLPESAATNTLIWDSYYNGGGVAAGDVNNDGLTDLYFTNTMKPNALYINKGNFVFEDITQKAGVD